MSSSKRSSTAIQAETAAKSASKAAFPASPPKKNVHRRTNDILSVMHSLSFNSISSVDTAETSLIPSPLPTANILKPAVDIMPSSSPAMSSRHASLEELDYNFPSSDPLVSTSTPSLEQIVVSADDITLGRRKKSASAPSPFDLHHTRVLCDVESLSLDRNAIREHNRNVSFSDTILARTFNYDSPPSRKRQRSSTSFANRQKFIYSLPLRGSFALGGAAKRAKSDDCSLNGCASEPKLKGILKTGVLMSASDGFLDAGYQSCRDMEDEEGEKQDVVGTAGRKADGVKRWRRLMKPRVSFAPQVKPKEEDGDSVKTIRSPPPPHRGAGIAKLLKQMSHLSTSDK